MSEEGKVPGIPVIPDTPETALAFRTWRVGSDNRLLSINAPSVTGNAGGGKPKPSWIHQRLASPEGGWPPGKPLKAECGLRRSNKDHGPVPGENCGCGIYATTELKVINRYLGTRVIDGTIADQGPVLGIVELGGRVFPAKQGYRAEYARVAAILLINPAYSLPRERLEIIADLYRVPLLVPHSVKPEDYRALLSRGPSIADEAEKFLKDMEEGQ